MSRHDNSMTMNVNLSPQLEVTVKNKVASGRYTNEVVREALRLMAGSRAMKPGGDQGRGASPPGGAH